MVFEAGQIWENPRINAEVKITNVRVAGVSFIVRDTSDNWTSCTEWNSKVLEQFLTENHLTLKGAN